MNSQARPLSFIRSHIQKSSKLPNITHGQKLAVSGRRSARSGIPQDATAFTAVGFAQANGECPAAAVIKCLEMMEKAPYEGHKLRGIYTEGVALTLHRQTEYVRIPLAVGDIINLDGCICRVENAPNENFETVELTEQELRDLYDQLREAA